MHSIQLVTDFLWSSTPPFLSSSGFNGQLKSPPIMMFSSDSRFSFCKIAYKFLKKFIRFILDDSSYNNIAPHRVKNLLMNRTIKSSFNQDCNSTCIGASMGCYDLCTPFILQLFFCFNFRASFFTKVQYCGLSKYLDRMLFV